MMPGGDHALARNGSRVVVSDVGAVAAILLAIARELPLLAGLHVMRPEIVVPGQYCPALVRRNQQVLIGISDRRWNTDDLVHVQRLGWDWSARSARDRIERAIVLPVFDDQVN